MKKTCTLIIFFVFLSACGSSKIKRATLRQLDVTSEKQQQLKVFIKPKSKVDIRKAYAEYLEFASKNDNSRLDAINRLAELEFELSNQIQKESENYKSFVNEDLNEQLYNERLNKTIELLSTSLKDYPKVKGNDKILYQLAKAYDRISDNKNSEKTLTILVKKHPKSRYYIESQFRLAEMFFSKRDYVKAEDTYTDIIGSRKNNIFYEKSLFKRGWSRFKQEYYLEAVDDYLEAVKHHNFKDYNELKSSQLNQFNEYFRAIGLSFSYLGGAEPLNKYFKNNPSFRYIYYSYSHVSDIYLKQQRYSDAARTLKFFIRNNRQSDNVPISQIKIIDIWKEAGFAKKAVEEIGNLYTQYNPKSEYWLNKNSSEKIYKQVNETLRGNILLASSYHHKKFQENKKNTHYGQAKKWYERYLKHFKSYARKDNVFYQYANLLEKSSQNHADALKLYELAAYDGDIILNKKSAYATIVLSDKMYRRLKPGSTKRDILNKHIKYATLYVQLYSNNKHSPQIILHAAELAFQTKQYSKSIALVESMPNKAKSSTSIKANIIKAHAYFKSFEYGNAEAAYFSVLSVGGISKKLKWKLTDKLALSIYKQAESASTKGDIGEAIEHYVRISSIAPSSSISSTGYYDAIALSMKNKLWDISIRNIKSFQRLYPNNKYSRNVTKKLSIAYLSSNQGIKAAQEFEKISSFDNNRDVKIAALWQAAELYESQNDIQSAIRSYEKYNAKYKRPFPQYMESMIKLTALYKKTNNKKKTIYWHKEILRTDKKTISKYKTDRTKYITSFASLNLAKNEHQRFNKQRLTIPLKLTLRKKKYSMQRAVRFYGQASKQGIAETATESTHAIANIYKRFSKDLLSSQRPRGLKGEELEQYVILLEDKAFPFEDKAIEFYEANMSHIKNGVYDKWVKQSHAELKELFPTRYKRTAKLDRFIDELH